MNASQTRQIRRMAKLKAESYWRKVDALAKAEGLTLEDARSKYDADQRDGKAVSA